TLHTHTLACAAIKRFPVEKSSNTAHDHCRRYMLAWRRRENRSKRGSYPHPRVEAGWTGRRREPPVTEHLDGIGDRIREERLRAGLSQRELARRLGVSPSLISQLESGHSNPSVATLY